MKTIDFDKLEASRLMIQCLWQSNKYRPKHKWPKVSERERELIELFNSGTQSVIDELTVLQTVRETTERSYNAELEQLSLLFQQDIENAYDLQYNPRAQQLFDTTRNIVGFSPKLGKFIEVYHELVHLII